MCGQLRGAFLSVPKKAWLLTGSQVPLGQGLGHVTVWLWQLSLLRSHTTLWRLVGIPFSLFLFLIWKILPCLCSLPVFLFLGLHRPRRYVLASASFPLLVVVYNTEPAFLFYPLHQTTLLPTFAYGHMMLMKPWDLTHQGVLSYEYKPGWSSITWPNLKWFFVLGALKTVTNHRLRFINEDPWLKKLCPTWT